MANEQLIAYIKGQLAAGQTSEAIKTALTNSGYDAATISEALSASGVTSATGIGTTATGAATVGEAGAVGATATGGMSTGLIIGIVAVVLIAVVGGGLILTKGSFDKVGTGVPLDDGSTVDGGLQNAPQDVQDAANQLQGQQQMMDNLIADVADESNDERILWKTVVADFSKDEGLQASPLLYNGVIYVNRNVGKTIGLDAATGMQVVELVTSTGRTRRPSPIAGDGLVYIFDQESGLFAFAPDGTKQWEVEIPGRINSQAMYGLAYDDKTVYVTTDKGLYAVSNGGVKWKVEDKPQTAPTVGSDGTIYVGLEKQDPSKLSSTGFPVKYYAIVAFDNSGNKKWEYETDDRLTTNIVATQDALYFGVKSVLVRISTSGAKQWGTDVTESLSENPIVVGQGIVYALAGTVNAKVHALDASTGSKKWDASAGLFNPVVGGPRSYPSFADGTVYVGSLDGKVYVIDGTTGTQKYTITADDRVDSNIQGAPAIGADGTVYFMSSEGTVFAAR